ncbi:MAG: transcription termination factor NusA, partial [Bifidobacteriaceae bacterium]|nr:transcription termination factor NusA [Bifidobacteriaceae bacterium]
MHINMVELRALEVERDIPLKRLVPAIEQAMQLAYEKTPGAAAYSRAHLDKETGLVTVWAQERDDEGRLVREWEDTPTGFGRIAAATARQVILASLRDAEDAHIIGAFEARENDVVTGTVAQSRDPHSVRVELGGVEGVLPGHELIPGEHLKHGDRVKVLVLDVARGPKGPSITLSRSHPLLVKRLFALVSPEVDSGAVEIVSIAREAGHRTKIAVRAKEPGLNAKGACIGQMGGRVRSVMAELGSEKIDIVDYSDDPAAFVAAALSPARVQSVEVVDAKARSARAIVPDFQLSLAIGREGQNARLAAKLTGWRIDIRSDAAVAPPAHSAAPPARPAAPRAPSAAPRAPGATSAPPAAASPPAAGAAPPARGVPPEPAPPAASAAPPARGGAPEPAPPAARPAPPARRAAPDPPPPAAAAPQAPPPAAT